MKEKLENLIREALESLGVHNPTTELEHPAEISHGDYSSNAALLYAKNLGEKPQELAEKIVRYIVQKKPEKIEKIEIAGPGFINFYLSEVFFVDSVKEILKRKDKYAESSLLKGKNFFVEHTQPNPFKEFHIGHLMNNAIGESIARIIKAGGAEVKTASYHGDVGMHVAKAVWAIRKGVEYEKAYAFGNKLYEESEDVKKEITDLNKDIYKNWEIVAEGIKKFEDYFKVICKKLGTEFDYQLWEHISGKVGKEIVEKNIGPGEVFEESEGAVVYKGEKVGLHTRVFLNSDRLPTYEAKELGLAEIKRKLFDFDQSITITGNEQDSFFKVTEVAIGEVFPELKGKLKHLSHGMLRLPTGKMSSRTGDIITAESLIDQVKEKILRKLKDRDFSQEKKEKISEIIAIGAIRYSILRQSIGGDIIFDFDKSISFEGDSGPYLQYSAVRAKSVLEKARENQLKAGLSIGELRGEIMNVERLLYRFPEIVLRAGKEYAPHYIATFLIELSSAFNSFYAKEKIVDKKDKNSPYKIALTETFLITIQNGLNLLGIEVPDQM